MFLHFMRWLRENTSLQFEILLLAGGPLVDEFAKVAPTCLVEALGAGQASYIEAGIKRAGFPKLGDRLKVARTQRPVRDLRGFDAIYLNSTTSALALRILSEVPPVVFSHIHELDSAFFYWFPKRDRDAMLDATDWFVACAQVVADNLIGGHGVERRRVSRHYEFIDPPLADPRRAASLRASFGIPTDAYLVGGSGMIIWRKGPDLFLQAAAALCRSHPDINVHFIWVGGGGDEHIPLESDIVKLGLKGRVHFVGEVDQPGDLFSTLDVFCLTSREDPYPLVMLEAASLGVPIVSFANGGAVEFASLPADEAGPRAIIVPYLDAEAMGESVAQLLLDDAARITLGRRGQERVMKEHTIDVGAAALYEELMARLLTGATAETEHDHLHDPNRTVAARHPSSEARNPLVNP